MFILFANRWPPLLCLPGLGLRAPISPRGVRGGRSFVGDLRRGCLRPERAILEGFRLRSSWPLREETPPGQHLVRLPWKARVSSSPARRAAERDRDRKRRAPRQRRARPAAIRPKPFAWPIAPQSRPSGRAGDTPFDTYCREAEVIDSKGWCANCCPESIRADRGGLGD
jgi:hypothetical protein